METSSRWRNECEENEWNERINFLEMSAMVCRKRLTNVRSGTVKEEEMVCRPFFHYIPGSDLEMMRSIYLEQDLKRATAMRLKDPSWAAKFGEKLVTHDRIRHETHSSGRIASRGHDHLMDLISMRYCGQGDMLDPVPKTWLRESFKPRLRRGNGFSVTAQTS